MHKRGASQLLFICMQTCIHYLIFCNKLKKMFLRNKRQQPRNFETRPQILTIFFEQYNYEKKHVIAIVFAQKPKLLMLTQQGG
jgi:hypothetical protein